MKKTLRFTLEVAVSVDGKCPDDKAINDAAIEQMDNSFPMLLIDDGELDCAVFVDSWRYTAAT